MVRTDLLPVLLTLPTRRPVIHVTRVPGIGEVIVLPDEKDPAADTRWRVLSVQHIAVMEDGKPRREVVAEVHCVEAADFDPWDGMDPSQSVKRRAGFA